MFQLNWSILTNLSFEPFYDPLMTFWNIAYGLSCLECHTLTFSQVSAQLKHFEIVTFEPLYDPLMTVYFIAFV